MPTFLFTNPNDLAALFILSTMFLLTTESNAQFSRYKLLRKLLLIASAFWLCFATGSRLSFIALLIFLFIYLKPWKVKYFLSVSVSVITVIVTIGYFSVDMTTLTSYSFAEGQSINKRLDVYRNGLQSIFHSYGMGYGIGTSRYYYREVSTTASGVVDAHSYLLDILINSGVLTFASFILLAYIFTAYMIIKRYRATLVVQYLLYYAILFSSSSSLFLWPHYIFIVLYFAISRDDYEFKHKKHF